jgi:hypothetical protein
MRYRRSCSWLSLFLLLVPGCADDGPAHPPAAQASWHFMALDGLGPGTALLAVHFSGTHGVVLGARPGPMPSFVLGLGDDGTWTPRNTDDLPAGVNFRDLAVDAVDSVVLAGFATLGANPTRILDTRGPAGAAVVGPGLGLLTIDGENSFYVAGGFSRGGQLWTSLDPGQWTADTLPLTGTNDSGFRDIDVRGDNAVACGFDDGADTLTVLLSRSTTTDWQKIPLGGGQFGRTFRCVALSATGDIFVGGISGAGGLDPHPFLAVRSPGGDWTDVVLPAPEQTGMVNDILLASDGAIYLACSGEVGHELATIIRADGNGAAHEITPFRGELFQLAEGPDGKVYAVGLRRDGSGSIIETGVMLVRDAP